MTTYLGYFIFQEGHSSEDPPDAAESDYASKQRKSRPNLSKLEQQHIKIIYCTHYVILSVNTDSSDAEPIIENYSSSSESL